MNILTVYMDVEDTDRVIQGIADCGARTLVIGIGAGQDPRLDLAKEAYRQGAREDEPQWEELGGLIQGRIAWQMTQLDETTPRTEPS